MKQDISKLPNPLGNSRRGLAYDVYQVTSVLHHRTYELLQGMMEECKAGIIPMEELVDIIHMFNKSAAMLKDLKTTMENANEYLERYGAMQWLQLNLNDPEKAGYIQGAIARGYPNARAISVLPKKRDNPEAYAALMNHLGVPQELVDKDLVSIHWPGMVEYATCLAESGKSIPGVNPGKTYPKFSINTKPLKGKELDDPSTLA